MNATTTRRHADEIIPDGYKQPVRITQMNPDRIIVVRGRNVRVGDIPLSIFTLDCGHKGKGIAVAEENMIFCDDCKDIKRVLRARG